MPKHSWNKKDNKTLPFKYKGRMRPDEFLRKCEEAVSINSKRLSIHKLILTKFIAIILIVHYKKLLKISQIYFIMNIEDFKISIYNNFGLFKLRNIETERKNINSILDALVKECLVYKQNQEYRNYYEIIFLGNDVQLLSKSIKESYIKIERLYPTLNHSSKTVDDEKLSCLFNNIINSESEIPICQEGAEFIFYQIKMVINAIIQEAEEEVINENLTLIEKGSNEVLKEIPFYIIHQLLNQYIHT